MAKAKFDSAKIKKTFAAHGEKFGFGVALAVMAMLLYSALQVVPYAQTPDDLKKQAASVRTRILSKENNEKPSFDMAKDGVVLPLKGQEPQVVIDHLLLSKVSPAIFNGIEWNKPLFDTKQRRREPEILALRDLRATFHNSAVNMKVAGTPGPDGVKQVSLGEEWLSVTGIVPLEDQTVEFTKAFQNALDTTTNALPSYGVYQIQRAVLTADQLEAPLAWEKVEPIDLKVFVSDEMAKWSETGGEYVDPAFVRLPLTQPLPKLPNGDYGDWAAHAPEIPRSNSAAPDAAAAPQPNAAAPAAPVNNDIFGKAAAPAAATPGAKPTAENVAGGATPYILFRFLDFKIEPRKFYRYRVKLVLANPNFNLDKAHLDKPELALGETREAAWSQPSPPIYVPVLERYFAGAVPPANGDSEPLASVGVKKWYPPYGSDIYFEFEKKLRGATLNDAAASASYLIPGEKKGTKQSTVLKTESLLADFGWERSDMRLKGPGTAVEAKTCNRPAELLVLTPRGELTIQTELGDMPLRNEKKAVESSTGTTIDGVPNAVAVPGAAVPGAAAPGSAEETKKVLRLK
ncbi:MAG: hypothetical protein K8U03_22040 [Planctomycetia bacterium]|nr:hypothetical protein [Planctomycetia bacterium]